MTGALGHGTPDMNGVVRAFLLQDSAAHIGVGAWLGTIMLFEVRVLIWPNQKQVLGLIDTSDEAKAKAARVALLASRTNTMLSIPTLFFMVAGTPAHQIGVLG